MAPRYKLRERAFVRPDDHAEAALHEAGFVFEYSGTPGRTMEPLNDEARAAVALITPLNIAARNVLPRRGDPAS
jgi:hypothetical protein